MISANRQQRRDVRALLAALILVSACSVDATVYRATGGAGRAASGSRANADDGGAGGTGSNAIYGCRSAGIAGVGALVDSIVQTASGGSEWLQFDRSCAVDYDCRMTLFAPVCDQTRGICLSCTDTAQIAVQNVRVGLCLGAAIERCCNDPASPIDCVFRDCIVSCGPQ